MARKPRVDFPGALYHVIVRGNRRAVIIHDDADASAYLERYFRFYNQTRPHKAFDGHTPDVVYFDNLPALLTAA